MGHARPRCRRLPAPCSSGWFLGAVALASQVAVLAQPAPASAQESAPSSVSTDAARKADLMAGERWRRAMFEFDQWLDRQPVYSAGQVGEIKADLAARVASMSSFELEYLLDTLEAKLAVLDSPDATEARRWLGRYLAVMADRKREEVLGEVPNILDMSSTELEAAVRRVEARRAAVEQQHRLTLETRGATAALVEAGRRQQAEEQQAARASRPAPAVFSPYRGEAVPEPPFSGAYESPTVVGVGPWGSFLLIPTTAF